MNHYPIFINLHQRAVLLVGAGHIAERKAEALLKAGASVQVVANTVSERFKQWFTTHELIYLGEQFQADFLKTVFLVIAATDNPQLNAQIFAAAEAAGKLCNSVDDPQSCSFIVPAVVDRNPIQIAICSGGTAPVLARLIRQKIELLLPSYLGKMAYLAGRWRDKVKAHLSGLSLRRRFWEQLFQNHKFEHYVACNNETAAIEVLQQQLLVSSNVPMGNVTLVGAGPGDAGLLTLHALQSLQAADVVLYDALVSSEILALIRRDADKIYVGKRAGRHQLSQQQTNQLLVTLAQQGKQVVRLKGGDPFVFGRGGEECQQLVQAGIAFRIIPGITAALGATAYAGIPLTHRDYAQTVVFVTGCQQQQYAETFYPAPTQQTLVIYMGTLQASVIHAQLMKQGYAADIPVALISCGTQPDQKVQIGRLADLADLAQQAVTPALIVVGEVVRLREQLNWFGNSATSSYAL